MLKNKNIVITGGANGIGYALGTYCAEQGAHVFAFNLHTPKEPVEDVVYLSPGSFVHTWCGQGEMYEKY